MVYACHAAALVHYHKGWTHHEVGEVVLADMRTVLEAAYDLGMTLPPLPPPPRWYSVCTPNPSSLVVCVHP